MSNRRMFSNRIANSAKFLQMPSESQLLYFHMVLRADDDGVVESYPLVKLLGVPIDTFKVLIAKGFIKNLNEDQVVVITDWLEHNTIRADRKVDSIYKTLLVQNIPDIVLIEPKPRSDVEDNSKRVGGLSTGGISQVKLSKVNTSDGDVPSQDIQSFIYSFKEINPSYERLFSNKTERSCSIRLIKKYGLEKMLATTATLPQIIILPYSPRITTPYELEKNLGKLIAFSEQHKSLIKTKSKVAFS